MVVIHSGDPLHAVEELEHFLENRSIADRLDEIASLLANQGTSDFRVRGYHSAADTVRQLNRPLREILEREGIQGSSEPRRVSGRASAHHSASYGPRLSLT